MAQDPTSAGQDDPLLRPVPYSLRFACVFAWLGALISLVLLQKHTGVRAFLCPAQGGCETVLTSRFAAIHGIPLPLLGTAFYLGVLTLLLVVFAISSRPARARLLDGVLWITVVGLTFSAGLMVLQFGVLHAFCPFCTLSAVVMAGLFWATLRVGRTMAARPWGASPAGALTLGVFAIFPAAILMMSGFGPKESPARVFRIDLSTARTTGPADAPVQLVVFSDFQCQFCRQFAPVLKRIRSRFPREVMVAYRYFPLAEHARAYAAAVAAECAGEQGAFWEYHDKLFEEGGDLSDAQLAAFAAALKLDQERFAECLKSPEAGKRVKASYEDADKGGLEGVPAVFLNGRRVEGALDEENLVRQIGALLETRK